jgi:integrase
VEVELSKDKDYTSTPKENISCHSFRHMFISDTIETCGMETARVLAGHKNTKITAKYNHPRYEVH